MLTCTHCNKRIKPGASYAQVGEDTLHENCFEQFICWQAFTANSVVINSVEWHEAPADAQDPSFWSRIKRWLGLGY